MRFLKLPDNEDAERKKWELSQDVRDDAETLVLQGWRQIKAVVYVRDMLKGLGKSVDPDDIAAWSLSIYSAPFFLQSTGSMCWPHCLAPQVRDKDSQLRLCKATQNAEDL